jgi:hypothetical protein
MLNEIDDAQFKITYIERICNDKHDLKQYYIDLNNNFYSIDLIIIDDELDAKDAIKSYIKRKYPKHISNSQKPRYPNVNLDTLVRYFIDKHTVKTTNGTLIYDNILTKIEDVNNDLREKIKLTDPERYEETEKKNGFYISYLFSDVESPSKSRKPIPKKVRMDLWSKNFNDETVGQCYVCSCKISYIDFHAGHVKAVAKGGTDSLQNLQPVCGPCNRGIVITLHY